MTKSQTLSLQFYDLEANAVKSVDLPETLFGVSPNETLVAQYVRVHLATSRQGTQSTKTRSEITGSTRKIYRQKGTGGARHGSRKSPTFVGGGVAFAPKPRDYALSMSKRSKAIVLSSVLSDKIQNNSLSGIIEAAHDEPIKTKIMAEFLKGRELLNTKVLYIYSSEDTKDVVRGIRNIPKTTILEANSVNPYILMNHAHVIFSERALQDFLKQFTP